MISFTHPSFCYLEGKKHDAGILRESQLLHMLEENAFDRNGQPMCLYGDPAYPLRIHLQVPIRMVQTNADTEPGGSKFKSPTLTTEPHCIPST